MDQLVEKQTRQPLDAIRSGEEESVDFGGFGTIDASADPDYGWLARRILRGGVAAANQTEVVVGTHRERKKALRVLTDHLPGEQRVYVPQCLDMTDPSIEFPDAFGEGVEPLRLTMGERIALTAPLRTRFKEFPTNSRALVLGFGRTYIRARFECGTLQEIPIRAVSTSVGLEEILRVALGARNACVSTAHSYQGPRFPPGRS